MRVCGAGAGAARGARTHACVLVVVAIVSILIVGRASGPCANKAEEGVAQGRREACGGFCASRCLLTLLLSIDRKVHSLTRLVMRYCGMSQ